MLEGVGERAIPQSCEHMMKAPPVVLSLLFSMVSLTLTGCGDPKERKALTALEGLRAAISVPDVTSSRFAEPRLVPENLVFGRAISIQREHGIHMTESGLDQQMNELSTLFSPRLFFSRARSYLTPGRCVKIADAVVPEDLRAAEPPRDWVRTVARRYESVASRLNGAYAADFRCGDGPRFIAVFTRPIPDDGTWRVAKIDVSLRGQ